MTGCVQNLEKCSLKTLFYRFLEKSKQKTFIKYRPAWTEYLTPTEKATPSNVLFPRKSQVRNAARTKRGIVARHFSIFRREFEAVSAASKGEISLMAMKYSRTFRCCQMTCPPGVPLAFKGGFKEICGRFGLQGGTCVCESHSGTRCHSLRSGFCRSGEKSYDHTINGSARRAGIMPAIFFTAKDRQDWKLMSRMLLQIAVIFISLVPNIHIWRTRRYHTCSWDFPKEVDFQKFTQNLI